MLVGTGGTGRSQREIEIFQVMFVLVSLARILGCASHWRQGGHILVEERRRAVVDECRESVDGIDGKTGVHGTVPVRVMTLRAVVICVAPSVRPHGWRNSRGVRLLTVLLHLHLLLDLRTLFDVIGEFGWRHSETKIKQD